MYTESDGEPSVFVSNPDTKGGVSSPASFSWPSLKKMFRSQSCLARPLTSVAKVQTVPVVINSQPAATKTMRIQTAPVIIQSGHPKDRTRCRHVQAGPETSDLGLQTDPVNQTLSQASLSPSLTSVQCQTKKTRLSNHAQQTEETLCRVCGFNQYIGTGSNHDVTSPARLKCSERLSKRNMKSCSQQTDLSLCGKVEQTSGSRTEIILAQPASYSIRRQQLWCMHCATQTEQPDLRGTFAEKAIYILKSVAEFREHLQYEIREDSSRLPVLHITRVDLYGKLGWEGFPLESVLLNSGTLTHRIAYLRPRSVSVADEHGSLGVDRVMAELQWILSIQWLCPGIDMKDSDLSNLGVDDVKQYDYPMPRWMDWKCPVVMTTSKRKLNCCSFCEHRQKLLQNRKRTSAEPLSLERESCSESDNQVRWTNLGPGKKEKMAPMTVAVGSNRTFAAELEARSGVGNSETVRSLKEDTLVLARDDSHSGEVAGMHQGSNVQICSMGTGLQYRVESSSLEPRLYPDHGSSSSSGSRLESQPEVDFNIQLLFQPPVDTDDIPLD